MVVEEKQVLVYMGTYVKDRKEGKYNDYVTYEENPEATYKSYINLKTGEIHNIEIAKVENFINNYEIIDIPVNIYNFDSYLANYNYVRDLYLNELSSNSLEKAIENIIKLNKTEDGIKNLSLKPNQNN